MSSLGNFVWDIAKQLRGVYKPHQYGDVILPMTILRRLDCIMEPSRDMMRELATKTDNPNLLATMVRQRCNDLGFYNTSEFNLARLINDPDGLAPNLVNYINLFSPNIDVFEEFKFEDQIKNLAAKNRLLTVVRSFAEVDLHPDTVPNAEMGDLFEELIRKFAENSNEKAGEHFTPRDAIRLMVELLLAEDNKTLADSAVVRTVYDPTAGTGGMLSVADDHLRALNPDVDLALYGQEVNSQSYAICKSDMIAKGQDSANIRLEDTLAKDMFAGKTFDYCMSNPPYGYEWKESAVAVKAEQKAAGSGGRFAWGLPKIGDGQMLFLTHLISKMRPADDGGGRAGIIMNGSPLFNGVAGSGESEIRRHILENDLVDAIVALPTSMFYNTPIATYVWILDNKKAPERRGKVQLIDGTSFFAKMRRSLGSKSREMSESDRATIERLYAAYDDHGSQAGMRSRIFSTTDFGYWAVTVERPLRLNFECSEQRIAVALNLADADKGPLSRTSSTMLREALEACGSQRDLNRDAFLARLTPHLADAGVKLTAPARKALLTALSRRDPTADICYDRKGNPEPDVSLRDIENIPFGWTPESGRTGDVGDSADGMTRPDEVIESYFQHEVVPHVPDAWIDHTKTRVGYEIPFTRHFYTYVPPRPLEEIDSDLEVLVKEIVDLLQEVEA